MTAAVWVLVIFAHVNSGGVVMFQEWTTRENCEAALDSIKAADRRGAIQVIRCFQK